eukprot:4007749-Pyramimonas_sp.AAC.1
MKLRQQLAAAEDKEAAAATVLAEATLSKQAAAKRLAQVEGVAEADGCPKDGNGSGLFNLSWNASIFDNLEDFEESERGDMEKLKSELQQAKDLLTNREEQ